MGQVALYLATKYPVEFKAGLGDMRLDERQEDSMYVLLMSGSDIPMCMCIVERNVILWRQF